MRQDRRALGLVMAVFLALFLTVPQDALSASGKSVKVRMDWAYLGYHAPFFVALDKGYYKAAGIDAELLPGKGSGTGVKIVASGAESFGFLDAGVAALSISKGAPLKVVAGFLQKNPTVVMSWKDNPVNKPKDMEGKSMAWIPGVATSFTITALWRVNGVDESKVKKISTTGAAGEALFVERKVDFALGFVNATWAAHAAKGYDKDMQYILAADWGVQALSVGVVVNTEVIERDPKLVRAFLAETMRAFKEVLANPEMGWKTVVRLKPEVSPRFAEIGLKNTIPLLHTEHSRGKPLGWMAQKDWETTLDFLATYMQLEPRLPLDRYYTNEFLPKE